MTKVKLFRFEVANASTSVFNDDDRRQSWFRERQSRLTSEPTIERKINEFLENKELVSLQVSTVDVHYHNNARGNTIHLIYTIVYKEE